MDTDQLSSLEDKHNRKIVELIYRTMLGRDPDADGLVNHCKFLAASGSVGYIIKAFQASDEYINRNVSGAQFTQVTPTEEVRSMGPQARQIYMALQLRLSDQKGNH